MIYHEQWYHDTMTATARAELEDEVEDPSGMMIMMARRGRGRMIVDDRSSVDEDR